MTKSVCGGVRSSALDSLGMIYHKKRKKRKFSRKHFFFMKKIRWHVSKKWKFSKSHFFRRSQFSRKNHFFEKSYFLKIFIFFLKCHRIFFHEKKCVSWKFSCFHFLWYLIPKLSIFELLTPPHTLLVTVYESGIFEKIRKISQLAHR